MGTSIRPEITEKSENWISKHRYYELKHFCLQYKEWKEELRMLDGMPNGINDIYVTTSNIPDPTWRTAANRAHYSNRIEMLERAAKETDPYLGDYILLGVTEDLSYDKLRARYMIPCCKDVYYGLYRRFFKLLSSMRD